MVGDPLGVIQLVSGKGVGRELQRVMYINTCLGPRCVGDTQVEGSSLLRAEWTNHLTNVSNPRNQYPALMRLSLVTGLAVFCILYFAHIKIIVRQAKKILGRFPLGRFLL